MDDKIFDQVHDVDLEKTMKESYIEYAMSVIASRALPDVRDGLKPVQRRVLYSMIELNNGPDKPHRKCARIVGDTMGKYHPHGDSSIYGALVNMAQDWSFRYTLVDGHGNFGSVDGDGAAAMRYTEARLSKISMEMLADINKDTVDFQPNFDETEREPKVLPSRFPNLLVNGTTGIAVGMATNIPPHNLREVINAVVKIIDNTIEEQRETTIEELLDVVKGPDFPTGATILGRRGIEEAYRTGRGKIRVRAVSNIETLPNGKSRIIVTELPYLVNKARLIEKIAELVRDKKIDGITDLNDHSSREGMRICIDLRKDANANVVLNQLYKHTQLQDTFGVIMLCVVPQGDSLVPKVLNLKELLEHYLAHQEDVVTRRTKYDLNKAQERAHILEGLLKALDNIDEVIRIIRAARNVQIGITPEQIEEIAANTKSSLSGTGYAVRKPVYLWMTEDALRQDYARYESAEQLDSHMSRMEHRGDMVMGDTRIEALDNSLFDKLQVFDGDISPMLEPNNNAIAIAVSLDDYGNLLNPEYYPKVGDTITATYADDVKYIDSRTGELRTEDTPEEYFQAKLYGARDVEYTVCALVELPNSMSYRYGGIGYDVVLSVDTAQRDSGGAVVPMLYLFDTADEADEAEAEQYLSKLTAGEFSPLMYESKATARSEFAQFRQMFLLIGGILCAIIGLVGLLNFFNAMMTGILSRRREFAVLQAVGMTPRQLKTMLIYEGLFYAMSSVSVAFVLSLTVGPLAGKMLGSMFWFFEYRFTVLPVLLTIPVFLLLGWLIPCMMYDNAAKCSIVDQLRDAQ